MVTQTQTNLVINTALTLLADKERTQNTRPEVTAREVFDEVIEDMSYSDVLARHLECDVLTTSIGNTSTKTIVYFIG